MTKTPEQSFSEMMARCELHIGQSAYTIWDNKFLSNTDDIEKFKRFNRWYDPSWTLPKHVQDVVDAFIDVLGTSVKICPVDANQRVGRHRHPSRGHENSDDPTTWKSWAYTICLPFDLNDYDVTTMRYSDYIDYKAGDQIIWEESKLINSTNIEPYTRLLFSSSHYIHGAEPCNSKWFYIIHDLIHPDIPFRGIETKIVTDISKDLESVINRGFIPQFMSELDFLTRPEQKVTELDWVPTIV